MSNLVVVAYPDEYRAAEVLATVQRMRSDYLIDIDDACYVTKDAQGKLTAHHHMQLEELLQFGLSPEQRKRLGFPEGV